MKRPRRCTTTSSACRRTGWSSSSRSTGCAGSPRASTARWRARSGSRRTSSAGSGRRARARRCSASGSCSTCREEMGRDLAALAAGAPSLPSFGIAGDITLAPEDGAAFVGRAPARVRRGARALRRRRGPRLPARARLLPQELSGEALRRDLEVALGDEVGDLGPVDVVAVEPERDPAARAEVGRQVEAAAGVGVDQRLRLAPGRLARDADDPVAVVVVEEVGERALADAELRVRRVVDALGLGQFGADRGQLGQPRSIEPLLEPRDVVAGAFELGWASASTRWAASASARASSAACLASSSRSSASATAWAAASASSPRPSPRARGRAATSARRATAPRVPCAPRARARCSRSARSAASRSRASRPCVPPASSLGRPLLRGAASSRARLRGGWLLAGLERERPRAAGLRLARPGGPRPARRGVASSPAAACSVVRRRSAIARESGLPAGLVARSPRPSRRRRRRARRASRRAGPPAAVRRRPRPPAPRAAPRPRRAAPRSARAARARPGSRSRRPGVGFGSFATRAAVSRSPALRISLAAASRAGVNSSSGSP